MVIKLQRYSFELVYVPGKTLAISDLLSRDSRSDHVFSSLEIDLIPSIMSLVLRTTPQRLTSLQRASSSDEEQKILRSLILNGWPRRSKDTPLLARPYIRCQTELALIQDLICRGVRVVIPRSERPEVLHMIHAAHQGVVACKATAREAVYWPGISKDIEQMVLRCDICQKHSTANQKEPLQSHPIPNRPWEALAIDYCHAHSRLYVVIVDFYSKYPEVLQLPSTSASTLIPALQSVFARHGYPDRIVSDNGPPFDSSAVADFMKHHSIAHVTSSPHYPQSNGQAERTVQTVKHALVKAIDAKANLHDVLLALRSTPHAGLPSPAQLLMGRRLRTTLPMVDRLLEPTPPNHVAVRRQLMENQLTQGKYYNRTVQPLPPLTEGQQILHRNPQSGMWHRASVRHQLPEPRSYSIITPDGAIYRRTRSHLRPYHSSLPDSLQGSDDQLQMTIVTTPSLSRPTTTDEALQARPKVSMTTPILLTGSHPVRSFCVPASRSDEDSQVTTRSGRVVREPIRYPHFEQ